MAGEYQQNNLLCWSTHRVRCTGCIPQPSLLPGLLREDGDSCPRVKTDPNNQTKLSTSNNTKCNIPAGLTKSISGLALKALKSSSFIDTNILASIPRDVPMPCGNIQQCRASYCSTVHTDMYFVTAIIWLSRLPFYQAEEGHSSQPERPKLALQPQAKGLKTEGNIKASLKKKETLLQEKLLHINQMKALTQLL